MNVLDYIDQSRVCFLSDKTKTECLKTLTRSSNKCLYNCDDFLDSLLKREALMSTGLGFELAFPHSKSDTVVNFFISIGIINAGVEWNSFDRLPVKIIFLIGGLVEEQERYLKLLAALSNLVNNITNRNELLKSQSPVEFYNIFSRLALTQTQAI
jgi:nitrogen PTS system EIIA component